MSLSGTRSDRQRVNSRWWFHAKRLVWEWEFTPLRATVIYLIFGFSALAVSDIVMVALFAEPLLSTLQVLKGFAEVLLTGGFIYLLTRRSRATVEARNDRLKRQREELSVLHRVLRHNLRNHLNIVVGHCQQLRERADGDAEQRSCEAIERAGEEILEYTESAEQIRRVTESEEEVRVDLSETIPELLSDDDLPTDAAEVRTEIPDRATVTVNSQFPEAIREIVANAIQHGDSERPELSITVDPAAGPPLLTKVEITDDGPGVPDHVREVILNQEQDQLLHLDGMGLWFVYWTVAASGGEFDITQRDSGGTAIQMFVPTRFPTAVETLGVAVAGITR
ncbi:sensor histidine kinase [Halorussus amylolyticus]|uniref:sensor histidine kinase n=1 Tax=Halorussus amylolyticus TaxID=1126242 RepID=UPI00138F67F5|nr:HAMP domain-containing sensor histidine kinase [Halorussus amylolyticus]